MCAFVSHCPLILAFIFFTACKFRSVWVIFIMFRIEMRFNYGIDYYINISALLCHCEKGSKYQVHHMISIIILLPSIWSWSNINEWWGRIKTTHENGVVDPVTKFTLGTIRKPVHNLWSLINKHLATYYLMFVRVFIRTISFVLRSLNEWGTLQSIQFTSVQFKSVHICISTYCIHTSTRLRGSMDHLNNKMCPPHLCACVCVCVWLAF